MKVEDRWYQTQAVEAGTAYLQDAKLKDRHGLIVAPTGSGKSIVIARLVERLAAPTVVLQPSKEILEQNLAKLAHYGYRAAVFSASLGRKEVGHVTLATIGSIVTHLPAFAGTPYVLVDECDLVNPKGGQYAEFLQQLPGVRILGLTATPYRLATNSLGSQLRFLTRTRPRLFRDVVHQTPIGELFRQGYLSPVEYHEPTAVDTAQLAVNSTGAEYDDTSVEQYLQTTGFEGKLVAQVQGQLAAGRRNVLVFTHGTTEARRVAGALGGATAAFVTAKTSPVERRHILEEFRAGRLRVVVNVGIVAIGFDYPELECVVLGRPTMSLRLFYQQVGRVLRPYPGKVAHVIDLVGLVRRFGRVEDLDLRRSGTKGEQWALWSGAGQLTNTYIGGELREGAPPPQPTTAQKRGKFFARRRWG